MLNKKSIKVISIVLLAIVLLATVASTACMAVSVPSANDVTPSGLDTTIGNILGIIRWGGIITAVIIAMFLGIKYITASPDGKAEIKKTLAIYIGGIALLLSASTIVTIIADNIPTGGQNT